MKFWLTRLIITWIIAGSLVYNRPLADLVEFNQPRKVRVEGYNRNIIEPFLSRDGTILLFNNLNAKPENTNLHWALRINDSTFIYRGEISGVNTAALEGVPSMDKADNLYFVSDQDYAKTLSTIYQCKFSKGGATGVRLVNGISKLQAGIVKFDVEVSANGRYLYFVDAQFNSNGTPQTADIAIAMKSAAGFHRLVNSAEIMQNVNTNALEYGSCISADELSLYFTRLQLPLTPLTVPQIFFAQRNTVDEPFHEPVKIKNISGFAEAPTIAPDQKTLYYHKKENNKFVLYMINKL